MHIKTLSIGLTGGIGSGKTLIGKVFEALGIPVFIADIEAKRCYEDMNFVNLIAKEISPCIIKDGKFSRETLASKVFSDREALQKLNSIMHPIVLNKFESWKEKQTDNNVPYVIMESAIIFEIGWEKNFDRVICIDTPMEVAINRVINRDNTTREAILQRINAQMPTDEKVLRANYVILHDNNTMLLKQILEIHKNILELCEK
ncbi:MAG: dephospho-CoA kinase [Bacteroidales bacterium]|jgi:dephospho-CoA kinase|nr:dephospho-CoA kinase [Bacteroidales bacterium]